VSHQIGDGTETNKNLIDRETFHNLELEQEASYLHNPNPKSAYPFQPLKSLSAALENKFHNY